MCWSLFLIKFPVLEHEYLLKKTPTQVFSGEIYEIFENTYFKEHLRMTASNGFKYAPVPTHDYTTILNFKKQPPEVFWKSGKHVLESLFNKVAALFATPIQVFSCEICRIFKNTYFERRLLNFKLCQRRI